MKFTPIKYMWAVVRHKAIGGFTEPLYTYLTRDEARMALKDIKMNYYKDCKHMVVRKVYLYVK